MCRRVTCLFVLIFCGNIISWTAGQNPNTRPKNLRHNTKPGSLHRKPRYAASNGPVERKGPNTRASSKDVINSTSGNLTALEPTEGELAKNCEDDVVSGDLNTTCARNFTSSSLNQSSQIADGSQFNASVADSSSSLGGRNRRKLTNSSFQDPLQIANEPQFNASIADSSNSLGNQDPANFTSSSFQNTSQIANGSQFNASVADSSNSLGGQNLQNFTSSSFQNYSQTHNESQFNASVTDLSNGLGNQNETLASTSDAGLPGSLISELPPNALKKSNLFLGFLPDDGSSGGTRQTIAQLNAQIGKKSAVYGWYAQAHSGVPFDGSQLLAIIDDVKACKCVFQPAIMPIGGWKGLTSWDNSQAVAIAQVLKKFTDEGIPVWFRFAHEVNYYQTDGTYQGNAADFKAGWAAVAAAVKKIAPSVKMWWTPNVSTAADYKAYEPDDMKTVDLVGIDYYPKQLKGNDFLNAMKEFHDKYAVDGRKFAIGETGLGWSGNLNDKTQWFNEICDAKSSLPEFISMAWFNFDKEYDYKIAGEPTLNQKFTALFAN